MKKRLWNIALASLVLAWPALAAGPVALEVSADDLAAAGVTGVSTVHPQDGRFEPPMRYFRSDERLSENDAKRDCADCADLIGVYAAEVPSAPGWASEPRQQFLRVGGRLQVRAYLASKKRIVTVTAPSEATVRKISAYLTAKFSD